MTVYSSPHAPVSVRHPEPWGACDRCGFRYLRKALQWQHEWRGLTLQSLNLLVCPECLDAPQDQLKPVIIGPDPVPVRDPRPGFYQFQMGITPAFDVVEVVGSHPGAMFDTSNGTLTDTNGNILFSTADMMQESPAEPNSSDRPGYPDQIYDTNGAPLTDLTVAWQSLVYSNLTPLQSRLYAVVPLQPGQVIPGGQPNNKPASVGGPNPASYILTDET